MPYLAQGTVKGRTNASAAADSEAASVHSKARGVELLRRTSCCKRRTPKNY